jgi:hypothetical protein
MYSNLAKFSYYFRYNRQTILIANHPQVKVTKCDYYVSNEDFVVKHKVRPVPLLLNRIGASISFG